MPRPASIEVTQTNLLEHPAVKAWCELRSQRVEPEQVDTLKERGKSAVYRLVGMGLGGSAIIAKRCKCTIGVVERTIYEQILPQLPVTTLHYYGFVEEREASAHGRYCWLFLEDAGGEEFSWHVEEHRTLAAHWLGTLHTSATGVTAAALLPDRGPSHYLEHLGSARRNILQNLANPALTADDLAVLQTIVSLCNVLEDRWNEVRRFCDRMPRTLVHGDFVGKNVRVRTSHAGNTLFALDWETAGWGVAAADLAGVDTDLYWSAVRETWPHLELQDIRQLRHYGKIFRWLVATSWESLSLADEWVEKSMGRMRVYQAEMANAIHAAPWTN